jgi:hypothetical protein
VASHKVLNWVATVVLILALVLAAKGMAGRSTPLVVVGVVLLVWSRFSRRSQERRRS